MVYIFQKLKLLEEFQKQDNNEFEYYKELCKKQILNGIMSKEVEQWFNQQIKLKTKINNGKNFKRESSKIHNVPD